MEIKPDVTYNSGVTDSGTATNSAPAHEQTAETPEKGTALWLDDYLPFRVAVAASEVGKVIAPYYHHFGLTMPELAILSVLYEQSPMTQQMIIARTALEKFAISRGSRALLAKDLIERQAHHTDGRSYWISLTASGRELYEHIVPMSLIFEEKLKAFLGSEERYHAAKTILRDVEKAAKAMGADASCQQEFSRFLKD